MRGKDDAVAGKAIFIHATKQIVQSTPENPNR